MGLKSVATIRTDIDRSPHDVWAVLGDIGGLSKWMLGVETSTVIEDEQVCELPDGTDKAGREGVLAR